MMSIKGWFQKSKWALSMIFIQVVLAGLQLLSRIILDQGSFVFAVLTYRHLVAALFVAPFAFFFDRDIERRLSWVASFWIFMNALFGVTIGMGLYYYGLSATSATYGVSFLNLIPIVTFAFSILARIEKLGMGRWEGKLKSAGVVLCVAGALIAGLYKGKTFNPPHSHSHTHLITSTAAKVARQHNWTRGTLMLVGSLLSMSIWYLLQVKLYKVYPSKYWTTMYTCIVGSMQSTVVGVLINRSKAAWELRWDLELATIIYSGSLATGAKFCLVSWVAVNQGPTYPPMFIPLSLVFVAISEFLFLGDPIALGTLIGMFMIVVGLYAFVWGKRRESKELSMPKTINGGGQTVTVTVTNISLSTDVHVQSTPVTNPT
ncbi:PREDICTED: WAT1-related protein At5g64700-like [Nelumbo nucifera]|uniref:WAT1-related protein n=2 Tax=Nelumbo nucifera TaxID=4432 RepID=A0A1U8A1V0_NELNU|nr:PREDICTED: WAT1-related protein At5g64700-like [Nelumbo nucifera]DAD47641.1 TPA_asm: hypothetical protein HUJ06_017578 [Nelumbo nucifera]